ncbi:uncharacterized protein LOC141524820 [Cotesia typhae]|uniref:uncharacterized protein LOC141524820 n=1 Tax=Cotesia typhae TaxID=2053667 RepID=UPI003D688DD7
MEGDQLLQPEEIEEQFHEEAGLYYTPFCQENDVRINASGKLWERYNLVKKFLRDGRILKSTPQREKISKTSSLPADETIIEKLKWLETNFQPFDQVEQYWIDTFDERRNSLIQQKDKNESVYSKFECLKNENAVTLIHLDFKKILPSASDEHIEEYWPYLCRFIREYSKIDEQLYSNAVAQNLISLLAEEPDGNLK